MMKTYLIDDDNLGNYLTESMLRVEGFSTHISTFDSAAVALQELLQQQEAELPQVIFLDLNMPEMNGWQFLDALKPHADKLQACHIFVLTSSLALSDMEKAKSYDLVAGLIHKPLDSEEVQAIRAQLQDEQ
ncbi:response regulator [Hymenobacter taeanensis]|uniref:Response regulator n=1 Tax=Hymenobacter taeanensis TaxID=2735321 RepID=A0A6M6BCS3_9BACT|nr:MULTISPECIES: response regulator [Hymenobacter]QJX45564.1 response regulator [Hymenobacter taeanensis]UOQ81189.1 response regulator [Hymenobacter sp. 5414T-23]